MDLMAVLFHGLFFKARIAGNLKLLIDALSVSLERLRLYFRGIVTESIPSGATTTLEAWYAMLNLKYESTLTVGQLQREARQAWTATGGLSIGKLEEQIQIAFPEITLETVSQYFPVENMCGIGMAGLMQATDYPSWISPAPTDGEYPIHYFFVTGTVQDIMQLVRLQGFLDRVKPAHMEPIYSVTVINVSGTAQAGLGMCGLMEAGKE